MRDTGHYICLGGPFDGHEGECRWWALAFDAPYTEPQTKGSTYTLTSRFDANGRRIAEFTP